MTRVPQESDQVLLEILHVHQHNHRDHTFSELGRLLFTIQTVPITLRIVTSVVAVSVRVVLLAVRIKNRITRL